MQYWDAIYLLDQNGIKYKRVQANVFTKTHGYVSDTAQADGRTMLTVLKAVVPAETTVTVGQTVEWKTDRYVVVSSVPIAAKGIVRHHQLELSRAVG